MRAGKRTRRFSKLAIFSKCKLPPASKVRQPTCKFFAQKSISGQLAAGLALAVVPPQAARSTRHHLRLGSERTICAALLCSAAALGFRCGPWQVCCTTGPRPAKSSVPLLQQ
eukprot:COSAG06_NODE_305_length_17809_cov_6.221796_25_plen_112_part_00